MNSFDLSYGGVELLLLGFLVHVDPLRRNVFPANISVASAQTSDHER